MKKCMPPAVSDFTNCLPADADAEDTTEVLPDAARHAPPLGARRPPRGAGARAVDVPGAARRGLQGAGPHAAESGRARAHEHGARRRLRALSQHRLPGPASPTGNNVGPTARPTSAATWIRSASSRPCNHAPVLAPIGNQMVNVGQPSGSCSRPPTSTATPSPSRPRACPTAPSTWTPATAWPPSTGRRPRPATRRSPSSCRTAWRPTPSAS